jgi:hypothetical protein
MASRITTLPILIRYHGQSPLEALRSKLWEIGTWQRTNGETRTVRPALCGPVTDTPIMTAEECAFASAYHVEGDYRRSSFTPPLREFCPYHMFPLLWERNADRTAAHTTRTLDSMYDLRQLIGQWLALRQASLADKAQWFLDNMATNWPEMVTWVESTATAFSVSQNQVVCAWIEHTRWHARDMQDNGIPWPMLKIMTALKVAEKLPWANDATGSPNIEVLYMTLDNYRALKTLNDSVLGHPDGPLLIDRILPKAAYRSVAYENSGDVTRRIARDWCKWFDVRWARHQAAQAALAASIGAITSSDI